MAIVRPIANDPHRFDWQIVRRAPARFRDGATPRICDEPTSRIARSAPSTPQLKRNEVGFDAITNLRLPPDSRRFLSNLRFDGRVQQSRVGFVHELKHTCQRLYWLPE
jgi:hypothetical protein